MLSINRTYDYQYINRVSNENKEYLRFEPDAKLAVQDPNNYFFRLIVDNKSKGYYLIRDNGDGEFECHLCIRKIPSSLNYSVSKYILEYFKQVYGAKLFTTHTKEHNEKAKAFAIKLGFSPTDRANNFEMRIAE